MSINRAARGAQRAVTTFHPLDQPVTNPPNQKLQCDTPADLDSSAPQKQTGIRGWYIAQQAYLLGKTFHQDWSVIPRAKREQWLKRLLFGWAATATLVFAMTIGMRFVVTRGYLPSAWEEAALQWVLHHAPADFSHAVWLGAAGDPIVIISVFLIGTVVAIRAGYPIRGLSIAASYLLVSLLVLLGWTIWDRLRPTLVVDGMAAPDLHSFPSGHMAQSVAVYGMFWYFWLRKIQQRTETVFALLLFCVWIGLIGLARLLLGAHWVTDIVAGTLIGLIWLLVLLRALRLFQQDGKTHRQ
ncbi:MAG: phosphatase PAP2 family protein [Caldilineaceae bacterium]|nr:phosphatase PAP2 family protein [Caldilineaceae bacterium]